MLKAIEQLVKGQKTCVGNHRCENLQHNGHEITKYIYFWTTICEVDYTAQTFKCNYGEYHTSSTSRAISGYRSFFNDRCFTEVFDDLNEFLDYVSSLGYTAEKRIAIGSTYSPNTMVFIKKYLTKDGHNIDLQISHNAECSTLDSEEQVTLTAKYNTRLRDKVKETMTKYFEWHTRVFD